MDHGRREAASLFIEKVARRAGIGVETIRFYEREGLLAPPTRKASGYRLYSEQILSRIQFIRRAKDLGFSLKEIKELLQLKENASPCDDVCERAEAKITHIEEKIEMLKKMKQALTELFAACKTRSAPEDCPILKFLDKGAGRLCCQDQAIEV